MAVAAVKRFTRYRKDKFLETYAKTGNLGRACQAAGVTRATANLHRNPDSTRYDAKFALAVDEITENYIDNLEEAADTRAVEGDPQPVFFRGEEVGTTYRKSDLLLMFRLKGLRPQKYRENAHITGDVDHRPSLSLVVNLNPTNRGLPSPLEALPSHISAEEIIDIAPTSPATPLELEERSIAYAKGVRARTRNRNRKAPFRLYIRPDLVEAWEKGWDETDIQLTVADVNTEPTEDWEEEEDE